MTAGLETELKFTLTGDALRALKSAKRQGKAGTARAKHQRLVSIYYDTADRRLRAAGLSLRVREQGGRFEQTVKAGGGDAGLVARPELTVPLRGREPDLAALTDGDLASLVISLVGVRPLEPVFRVDVRRTVREVETDDSRIEIALDEGEISAGDRRAEVHEAEFELKAGDLRALFPVARAALAGTPVRLSRLSKADRGFRLLNGDDVPRPETAGRVEIAKGGSTEELLRAVLRSCLVQIAANIEAVSADDDPEGPHQLRVGLRRLRSALKLFKPVMEPSARRRLNDQARRLGRSVGTLRDLDVLSEEIVAAGAGHSEGAPLQHPRARPRDEARTALRAELDGEAVGEFLIDLLAFTEGRGWLSPADLDQSPALAEPAADFARQALAKRWARTAKIGRDVEALSPEERHELRKSFKTLRYTLEFVGPVIARKELKSRTKRVKQAQEVLGYLNDVKTARELLRLLDESRPRGRAAVAADRAAGFCLGWHEREAERVWEKHKATVSLDPAAL